MNISPSLLSQQCAVLRSSRHSRGPLDSALVGHVELVSLLARAQADVDGVKALEPAAALDRIDAYASELESWYLRRVESAKDVEHTGLTTPFQQASLYLQSLAANPIVHGAAVITDPRRTQASTRAVSIAQQLLSGALVGTPTRPVEAFAVDYTLIGCVERWQAELTMQARLHDLVPRRVGARARRAARQPRPLPQHARQAARARRPAADAADRPRAGAAAADAPHRRPARAIDGRPAFDFPAAARCRHRPRGSRRPRGASQ